MIETIYQHYIKAYKVSTDSRKIEKDAVFFALKGENFEPTTSLCRWQRKAKPASSSLTAKA